MFNTPISSSLEDVLEAIAEILEKEDHVHASFLAEKLNMSKSSVTSALQSLAAKDFLEYQPHMPVVKLTAEGAERAAVIRHRHTALRNFFSSLLKLSDTEADDTACKVEHVVGQKVMSRFVALAEAVLQREDCAELRRFLAETMPSITADPNDELIPLSELKVGQSAVVSRVSKNLRGVRKFADLGLVPGTLLCLEGHSPFGELLRVRVLGTSLSLRVQDAVHIAVRPVQDREF